MSTWDGNNFYYSGQGVVLIGKRDSSGKPAGLLPVGNCSALKISLSSSVLEHKESQTGQRGIDLRITTELKNTLSVTVENYTAKVLSDALRGNRITKLGASVTSEAINGYLGAVQPFKYARVSSVVLKRGATTLTVYTNDATPFDYKYNADAGSFWLNDGSIVAASGLTTGGTAPTAITVGNPTEVTVANTAAVGSMAMFSGFTGADAALLNGKAFEVVAGSDATKVKLNVDTTGKTITLGTPLSFFDGVALSADYTYAGQNIVEAFTVGAPERWLRFEGLNTADTNSPVVVDVFKFLLDPTKDLDLISDGLQAFVLEGSVLADPLQTTGSKYFRETLIR